MSNTLLPEYKTILEEIGAQLRARKGLLFRRTLLLVWPGILILLFGYYIDTAIGVEHIQKSFGAGNFAVVPVYLGIIFGALFLFTIVYGMIVSFIFEIEKQIWIDSFFDKRNLDPAVSWRIATKLFWSALWMRVCISVRYYFLPILGVVLVIALLQILSLRFESLPFLMFIPIPLGLIGLIVYAYYIRTTLRYTWFIFLDRYTPQWTFGMLMDEVKKLNAVAKTEAFKKSLITTIGVDTVGGLTNAAMGAMTIGIGHAVGGKAGELLGSVTQMYSQTYVQQATDLANIAAQYILYRHVVREVYGEHQIVNEVLYTL